MTEEKINVLFLMIQMAMGGAERLICNLVRRLDRRVFVPSVAWFVNETPLKEFEDLGVPMFYIPKARSFDWSCARHLARIVKEHRIDVVNAHHFMPFFYGYCATRLARRGSTVYTEHSEHDVFNATGKWKLIGAQLVRSCEGVIAVSDRVSDALTSHFGIDRVRVHTIRNGVDVEVFDPATHDRCGLRERLGYQNGDFVIGIVANFRRNKNHIFLVKAFHRLLQQYPNVRLVIAGQGFGGDTENSEAEVAAYVDANDLSNVIRMFGYCPDAQNVLGALDVFCLTSYREGLPLSLIEAMASGLPVVGTAVEGIQEVIEPEVNGLLVKPDDVDTLTKCLARLVENESLRARMGQASRLAASRKYDLSRCVVETERLFSTVHEAAPA